MVEEDTEDTEDQVQVLKYEFIYSSQKSFLHSHNVHHTSVANVNESTLMYVLYVNIEE